jgi:uncharacterized protein (DUF697 family)
MSDDDNKTDHHENQSCAFSRITDAFDWAYARAVEGVPPFSGASDFAEEYKRSHPDLEAAIDALIKWQALKAGLAGLVAGLPGGLALPVAIPVNVLFVLSIQLRMIAAIAHLRGYDIETDKVKRMGYGCLVDDEAVNAVKEVGIKIGTKVTARAIESIPRTALVRVNQAVGFRLLAKVGPTAVINLSRVIPVVGGLVSGGIDAAVTRTIGGAAKTIFVPLQGRGGGGDHFHSLQ